MAKICAMAGQQDNYPESLAVRRKAVKLDLEEAAGALGVSRWTVRRWEQGTAAMSERQRDAIEALLGDYAGRPAPGERVLADVSSNTVRLTVREWDQRLDSRAKRALRQLLADGRLVYEEEPRHNADGRRYLRKVVAPPPSSERNRRGADRGLPPVTGAQLKGARRFAGITAAALATLCGLAPSGVRRLEVSPSVPRGRLDDLVAALGLPDMVTAGVLHEARTQAGWSLADVAGRVGVHLAVVAGWESGRRPIPRGRLLAVASAVDGARADTARATTARRRKMADAMVAHAVAEPGVTDRALLHEHRSARVGRSGPKIDARSVLEEDLIKTARLVAVSATAVGPRGGQRTVRSIFAPRDAPSSRADMRITGVNLRARRERCGATRGELAASAGLSYNDIFQMEKLLDELIPLHHQTALLDAIARMELAPPGEIADKGAEDAVRRYLLEHPGAGRHRIAADVSQSKAIRRALQGLIETGEVIERGVSDSLGRQFTGMFLAQDAPPEVEAMTGPELRQLRIQEGWTPTQLAFAIGVSAGRVTRWERGERRCPPDQLAAIRAALAGPAPSIPERQSRKDQAREVREQLLLTLAASPGGVAVWELPARFIPARGQASIRQAIDAGMVHVEERMVERSNGVAYVRRFLVAGPVGDSDTEAVERMTGAELRRIRVAAGLTQAALGERIGCPNTTVSGWETGRIPIGAARVAQLRSALAGAVTSAPS